MGQAAAASPTLTQRILDRIERVGNSVPHPVIIFLIMIAGVMVLSHMLYLAGAAVSYQVANPETHTIETVTTSAKSLLTAEGIRHIYTRVVPNFMGFTAVGLLIVAMIGVGVAEEAGLVKALICKLVAVSPSWALTYILSFVGVVSSIAADAGYLVLIPLAATAFMSVGRHPLAGLALGFAAVASAFNVNVLIKPLDAVLTELTNDAIRMINPALSIGLTANLWFSIVSALVLAVIVALVTERLIEPRLGKYRDGQPDAGPGTQEDEGLQREQARGLNYAGFALIGVLVVMGLLTLPPGAPLRNPADGALIGDSPFMSGLIVVIAMLFLATGIGYGIGARTIRSTTDVIAAMTKALAGLAGTILLFVVISQFADYFNYSNIPKLLAVAMSDVLKNANIGSLWLLLGFIVVIAVLNLVFTTAIGKWAIFAPVFVPLLLQLGVDPAAVLAAFRTGDSPTNSITPLNPYFALVIGFAQKYDQSAGVGTIVALMLPYVAWIMILWTMLFAAWHVLGIPWGLK